LILTENARETGNSLTHKVAARFGLLRLVLIGLGAALGLAFVAAWATAGQGSPTDFHAYWAADPVHPYTHPGAGPIDAFQYTPAAALVAPLLRLIPFALAIVIWRICQLGAILSTVGPWAVVVLLAYPVASEMNLGNINLIIGLAIVAGFRWPAVWAFVLLTKPTCGVGLLWFVVRRDWRSLRIALGVTAILAAASFVLVPGAWFEYVGYLLGNPAPAPQGLPVLWLRLPFAIAIAIASAYKNWRPGAVVAAWLALPVWWYVSPSVLVGVLAYTWPSPLVEKRRLKTSPVEVRSGSSGGRAWIRVLRNFRVKSQVET
jgi:hypothetical protein